MKTGNCELCGKEFTYNGYDYRKRFCGRSCSSRANNLNRAKHHCKHCGSPTWRSTLAFCSASCKDEFLLQEWLAGREGGGTKYGYVRSFVRRYLMNLHQESCEECGFNKVRPSDGKSILQVDHIDGDCSNSRVENLRLLCPNCHAMTETYCGKNSNSARAWKKKYYSDSR